MKNTWNYEIPPIVELIKRPELRDLLSEATLKMLRAARQSSKAAEAIVDTLFVSQASRTVDELEKSLHSKIVFGDEERRGIRSGMHKRASIIFAQIEKYLQGDSLADVGCGHGLIAWLARKHFREIELFDVVDYRDRNVKLPFIKFSENDSPPLNKLFGCTLLITVLHHASNPLNLLREVWRQTEKRLIIIESVFGVGTSQADSPLPRLDEDIQLSYAVFCDWFYNRVLNQGVPVPFNFNTPQNWRKIFAGLPATISFEEDLGVDLDIVPEHHFLFVLDTLR